MSEAFEKAHCRIALVCMPFASIATPSIQIGLLTAIAREAGYSADSYHFNLDLAAMIGSPFYEELCNHRGQLTTLLSQLGIDPGVTDLIAYYRERSAL